MRCHRGPGGHHRTGCWPSLVDGAGSTCRALGTCYRRAVHAGIAGCLGVIALDRLMVASVTFAVPSVTQVTAGAMLASSARIALSMQTLRPILTR